MNMKDVALRTWQLTYASITVGWIKAINVQNQTCKGVGQEAMILSTFTTEVYQDLTFFS